MGCCVYMVVIKRIHELQATISALRAESESYQQKYELEAAVSKVCWGGGGGEGGE